MSLRFEYKSGWAISAHTRCDRDQDGERHFEDFVQVSGWPSQQKKYNESYAAITAVLMSLPQCGSAPMYALLGNTDMHLKNIDLVYLDRKHPKLGPAYDVTATGLYKTVLMATSCG